MPRTPRIRYYVIRKGEVMVKIGKKFKRGLGYTTYLELRIVVH